MQRRPHARLACSMNAREAWHGLIAAAAMACCCQTTSGLAITRCIRANRTRKKGSDFTEERRTVGHKLVGGARNGRGAGEAGVVDLNVAPRVLHLQPVKGRVWHQGRKHLYRLLHAVRARGRFDHKLAEGLHETPRGTLVAPRHHILAGPHRHHELDAAARPQALRFVQTHDGGIVGHDGPVLVALAAAGELVKKVGRGRGGAHGFQPRVLAGAPKHFPQPRHALRRQLIAAEDVGADRTLRHERGDDGRLAATVLQGIFDHALLGPRTKDRLECCQQRRRVVLGPLEQDSLHAAATCHKLTPPTHFRRVLHHILLFVPPPCPRAAVARGRRRRRPAPAARRPGGHAG